MSDTKKRLSDFLNKLTESIEGQGVQSESDLEQIFRVEKEAQLALWRVRGITKTEENATLLEILGYKADDVEDHPVRIVEVGTTKYAPDYILKRQQKLLAIVDLKAPDVNLENDNWARQICSYCRELKVPLGVLFNGREIRVFVNTELKGLTRYKELFSTQPVAAADYHNEKQQKQMVEIILKFAATSLENDPVAVAKRLALKRKKELEDEERQRQIQEKLEQVLSNPSTEVLAAISTVDGIWEDFKSKPSENELIAAWKARLAAASISQPSTAQPRRNVNRLVRQKVAEVCATKGQDYLESKPIKGLRFRNYGGNGYHLVPHGEGVPPDLYVQGVPTEDAKRIIQQLEQLLSS